MTAMIRLGLLAVLLAPGQQAVLDAAVRKADEAAAKGDFAGALKFIADARTAVSETAVKRKADAEIRRIENLMRGKFNDTVHAAEKMVGEGRHADAIASFDALAKSVTPEIADRCKAEAERIKAAKAAPVDPAAQKATVAADEALVGQCARMKVMLKDHQFEKAANELNAAVPALKDAVEDEKLALKAAADFWKAADAGLKGRVGQEVSWLLADGKRVSGRFSKIDGENFVLEQVLEQQLKPKTVMPSELSDDQWVLFAFGRTGLAENLAASLIKAAMFFYYTGKDPLARVYLATAKELGADIAKFEKVWRSGFFRPSVK